MLIAAAMTTGVDQTYVERVRHDTCRFMQQLLAENARLRGDRGPPSELETRFAELEQANAELAGLCAAIQRLHTSLRRQGVLVAIEDMVIDLVGSEEFTVLALGDPDDTLRPVVCVGVGPDRAASLRASDEVVRRALLTKAPVVDPRGDVIACIPLVIGRRILGLIAIFSLAPRKREFGAFDHELFALLGRHAAKALYCASLHEWHGDTMP